MTNPTVKEERAEERATDTRVYFLNQGEGIYTKEIRTIIAIITTTEKGEKKSTKRLLRRIVLARYRVVQRSEKYHVIYVNQYNKKKIYLRRIS